VAYAANRQNSGNSANAKSGPVLPHPHLIDTKAMPSSSYNRPGIGRLEHDPINRPSIPC